MAWPAGHPPTSGATQIASHEYLKVYRKAIREKALALGFVNWPLGVTAWDSGTITGLTATTLTDSTKAWATAPKRWVSYTTGADWLPVNYDVVIGNATDEPSALIRVPITDNTATVLTMNDITSWVNANYVASIVSLVGKTYSIIRRAGQYYPFWHERWPRRPNDRTILSESVDSATTSSITVTGAAWTVNVYAGKAFFGIDTAGIVQRVTIASNTADTLTWTAQSWTASTTSFEIQTSTAKVCWPGVTGEQEFAWYRGYQDQVYTHLPGDTVSTRSRPATTLNISKLIGGSCTPDPISLVFNTEIRIDFQDDCGDRDKHFAEHMWKTFRGMQLAVQGYVNGFIETRRWNSGTSVYDAISWDGAAYLDTMRTSTLMRSAGVNYHNSFNATSNGAGEANFVITGLPTPSPFYHYTVIGASSERVFASGQGTGTPLVVSGLGASTSYRCIVALGWKRTFPRMFRYLYPRTWWEPDLNAGSPVDPPTEDYPGAWYTNAASTNYLEYSGA